MMRKTKISIVLSLIFILWALPGEVAPQVYRYTDKNGVVHFTDTPTDTKFSPHKGPWVENKPDNSKEVTEAEGNMEEIGRKQEDVIPSERQLPPIKFASPPNVIVIPGTNVYVVPDLAGDLFFYDGWWWRPWRGGWYRSQHYSSGWVYYKSVPSFHVGIPSGWRNDYRNRQWSGQQWNYQQIPHQQLQRNWSSWKESRHWEKQQTWGVQGLKPHPQQPPHPQRSREVQSQRLQPHPQQQPPREVQYQRSRPQDWKAPQQSNPYR